MRISPEQDLLSPGPGNYNNNPGDKIKNYNLEKNKYYNYKYNYGPYEVYYANNIENQINDSESYRQPILDVWENGTESDNAKNNNIDILHEKNDESKEEELNEESYLSNYEDNEEKQNKEINNLNIELEEIEDDNKKENIIESKFFILKYVNLIEPNLFLLIENIMMHSNLDIEKYIVLKRKFVYLIYIEFKKVFRYDQLVDHDFFDYKHISPKIKGVNDFKCLIKYIAQSENYITNIVFKKDVIKAVKSKIFKNYISIDELKTDMMFRKINIFHYLYNKNNIDNKPLKIGDLCYKKCFWLYGKAGVGKTTLTREIFHSKFYHKDLIKTWNNYMNEQIILVEIKKHLNNEIGYLLDEWSDIYIFQAENNGKMITPFYSKIIFISKNSLEEYFESNKNLLETMKIRCEKVHLVNQNCQKKVAEILLTHQ